MKYRLLYCLSLVLLLFITPSAQAGFRIKKNTVIAATAGAPANVTNRPNTTVKDERHISLFNEVAQLLSPSFRGMAGRGWVGILSLVCGVAGFFYPFFGFAALLFGFIGMGRRNRNTGIAIAGFVLGLIVVIATIFGSFSGFPLY